MLLEGIQLKIQNARELDFGTIFSQCIELFKKTWLQGFFLQIFTFILVIPIVIIIMIPLIGAGVSASVIENGNINHEAFEAALAGFSIFFIVFLFIGIFIIGTAVFLLKAGFFRIMRNLDLNRDNNISDFFYYFKTKYYGKAFLLLLASMGISVLAALLCFFPLLYVLVPLSYLTVFFAFDEQISAGEIITASFNLGNKTWLITFGIIIILAIGVFIISLIPIIGTIANLFLTALIYHPIYLIYKEVIGFDDESESNEIRTY